MDPINFFDKIKDIPKFVLISSDDDIMKMGKKNIGWLCL
jgi:hypothetical protein